MARLRNRSDQTLHVPEFSQTVEPDGVLDVPDDRFKQRVFPEDVWAEVETPKHSRKAEKES